MPSKIERTMDKTTVMNGGIGTWTILNMTTTEVFELRFGLRVSKWVVHRPPVHVRS